MVSRKRAEHNELNGICKNPVKVLENGKKILKDPNLDYDEKVVKHLEALMDTNITVHTTKGREENELYASFIEFH